MDSPLHLAKRFFFSLRPGSPDPDRERCLLALLNDAEILLYQAQAETDRVHSIRCAGYVAAELGEAGEVAEVIVASALHDVGKVDASLGTVSRVIATVVDGVPGFDLRRRSGRPGFVGRLARYIDHDLTGARMLGQAGSSALAQQWAEQHHWPQASSTIDPMIFDVLHRADHS